MKKLLLICSLFVLTLVVSGQDDPQTAASKLGPNPVFIIDGQQVTQAGLSKYSPDSIATVVMLYDTSATKRYGAAAKDGAVIIETRSFARQLFISFFQKSSQAFDSLYKAVGGDASFLYIINDKVQEGNYEGNLSAINDQIVSKFKNGTKQFGILIHSKKPKDLYRVDEKF